MTKGGPLGKNRPRSADVFYGMPHSTLIPIVSGYMYTKLIVIDVFLINIQSH